MTQRAFIDGTLWCAGMACVYPHATGDGKVLVAIIMTGAVALGTFGYSRSPSLGMIYLALTCLGSGAVAFVTGVIRGSWSDMVVHLLAILHSWRSANPCWIAVAPSCRPSKTSKS